MLIEDDAGASAPRMSYRSQLRSAAIADAVGDLLRSRSLAAALLISCVPPALLAADDFALAVFQPETAI